MFVFAELEFDGLVTFVATDVVLDPLLLFVLVELLTIDVEF